MNNWKKVKLSDIIEFNPRETLSKGAIAKKIAMEKLEPFTRDIPEFEYLEYRGGTKFRNGDTLMARITPSLENGKTSKVNLLDEDEVGFGSTEFIVVRAKENISDENFVYYLMIAPSIREVAIKSMVGTSGRQRVQLDVVKNHEILCPPLKEQIRIGKILKALDDKIENNKKINHHLEEILQANLEKQLESISIKSKIIDLNLTVSDHVANGSFKSLKDNVKLVEKTDYALFLRNIDLKNHLNGERRYVTESSYEFLKKSRLYGHEVIISNVADVGSVHRVPKMNMPMVAGNNVVFLQSENSLLTDYLYVYFNSRLGQHDIMSITSGSAQQKFNKTDFRNLEIPILSDDIIKKKISSILHYIDNIHEEIACLMKIRATLLPKLLSGEISVN
ncbi:restriction endonuclease subunit S [Streptococcus sanguinis]|uniref:Type I restriction modification DNA specificity domain protein n=1 Tax=Streptococcus sanguinis SK405 TaxID=888817 RepID=A0ABC9PFW0_STRSA|nr:restriction endonuclease subunit S [Streptococcus sanguinis]EGC25750.1 type I restriction modification DNA specificity domain protein [Streptococcus sanguinis SK405]MCY7015660.1 restriction endonuclease subunit S [Streptococcus sanguinis]